MTLSPADAVSILLLLSGLLSLGPHLIPMDHVRVLPLDSATLSPHSANPLWYAHYDNLPAFTDFASFGGWKTPYAKQVHSAPPPSPPYLLRSDVWQYAGDVSICGGFDVDKDYAPNWD
jgi:hypothetical protein